MATDKEMYGDIGGDDDLEFSLESILAEFKGSAYIKGDKKTPPHILSEQAERIVMEVSGRAASAEFSSEDVAAPVSTPAPEPEQEAEPEFFDLLDGPASSEEEAPPAPVVTAERDEAPTPEKTTVKKTEDIVFFDNYRYADKDDTADIAKAVEAAIAQEEAAERAAEESAEKALGIFSRQRKQRKVAEEEIEEPEPPLDVAAKRFASACNAVSIRFIGAFILSILMLVFTLAFKPDSDSIFAFRGNFMIATGVLMILQILVMLLGLTVITRGVTDFYRRGPNAESLILVSCALSLVSGFYILLSGNTSYGLPYCAVSAISLTCALWGEKLHLRGMTDSLKTAVAAKEPASVTSEFREDLDKTVLKKSPTYPVGFYRNLVYEDVAEMAYRYASPILIVAVFVLSVFSAISTKEFGALPQILSATAAGAASFSALLAFSLPFGMIARNIRKSGAAIAGWGGADDICSSDGVSVTDEDLFPTGTLSISGVRIFEDVEPEKAIRYTSSIIIASGSGLARVFSDLLRRQGMVLVNVGEFTCYEGGVGALIKGERVMTGSAAFMNLMGIRIPQDMNLKNAVFTSVNDRLIAMFAINYVPINTVQNALVNIIKEKVKLFFAVRDFNITPLMLEQKFKISLENVEYITAQSAYGISNNEENSRAAAVLSREGLGPLGEAIAGGRVLKRISTIATIISVVSSFFGLIMMFFMCNVGSYDSASASNLLIYMLCMLIVNLVVCNLARFKR